MLLAGASVVAADAPHTHPDDVDDESDLDAVGQWLGDRMGEIHVDCSEGVSVGSFDACDALDDEHGAFLDQYVTVEDETETDRASDRFEATREDHIEYVELLEEFYATLDTYDVARAEGDDQRAAELAAELRQLAREIEELGVQLQLNLEELDALTTIDLDPAIENTNQTTTEVSALYGAVESETFIETTLTADANATASFAEPAMITGNLRDENGTAIENGQIVIDDGDGVQTTRTDANGTFDIAYRPAPTSTTGATELDVRYEPQGEAPYQRASATLDVDIGATPSTIELDPLDPAAFQDPVIISGAVHANGTGISDVPVHIELTDDVNITVETDSEGHFEATISLPVMIPPGETTVEASVGDVEFALEPSAVTTTLEVIETPTTLSVETDTGSGTATVSGQLHTINDIPVTDRPIDVAVGAETYTVDTDDDGTFVAELPAADAERNATVTYAESGANLGSSTETVGIAAAETAPATGSAITEQLQADASEEFISENPLLASLLALVATANVFVWGAIFAIRLRRWWASRVGSSNDEGIASEATDGVSDLGAVGTGPESASVDSILSEPAGPDLPPEIAVQRAYAAVRSVLGKASETDDADVRTHWEFYHELASEVDSETQEALRTLTEAFEAATFSPSPIGEERATDAVDAAERCVTVSDGGVIKVNK